ncbi:MAG: Transcriptional regulator, MarR family [uncultured bacterium (gcode 4)]|uniref:Transcriptional regulator, MarR family n=1 Tax=uncultured bacterium (gcode 4) TaxID=1234023 RepID=K2GEQ0_9BACT|nr:MAG: Transcriptional regulator, MarR family [uncultured bacterium (gcode 4)]
MNTITPSLNFIINISKFHSILSRRFDSWLWGLGLTEFLILYRLSESKDWKMKRIDLANKIWLTASWITRILLPMEKIWLVSKEKHESDARISLVSIAPGWKTKLEEALERAELICLDNIWADKDEKIKEFSEMLNGLGWKFLWN